MSERTHQVLSTLEDPFSPIEAAARELPQTSEERRIAERIELGADARYRFPTIPAAASWSHGVVVNLSETGGCFLVDGGWSLVERLDDDEWVPLDVEFHPAGDVALRLRGEIMWVQPDGGGEGGVDRVGVRFDAVTPDDRARLHLFLENHKRAR